MGRRCISLKTSTDKSRLLIILSALLLLIGAPFLGWHALNITINNQLVSQLAYGQNQIMTIALNDSVYVVTDILVPANRLDDQIGLIQRQVSPRPERSGDIAINIADAKNFMRESGLPVFLIAGCNQQSGVAIQLDGNSYYLCRFYCKP
jgi:hypothetical protein